MLQEIPQDKILSPQDAAKQQWDFIIIGGGMGGGHAALVLAKAGFKTLIVDKGAANFSGTGETVAIEPSSEEQQYINGKWPTQVRLSINGDQNDIWAPLGCGLGGSSILYAAALQRLRASDFDEECALPTGENITWPFNYSDIEPFYQQAEAILNVRGTLDPLETQSHYELAPPPAMCEQDQHLFQEFKQAGLHPYRLHVGLKYVNDCSECGGHICFKKCKQDAYNSCIVPALGTNNLFVCEYAEVARLNSTENKITGVSIVCDDGNVLLNAHTAILSAGAYATPTLLLRSTSKYWPEGIANSNGQVGKNLMFHASDYLGVWPKSKKSRAGPNKTIALRDFYHCEGEKMGEFQSTGLVADFGLIMYSLRLLFDQSRFSKFPVLRHFLRIPATIASKLYGTATVFTTIVEDYPYQENKVIIDDEAPSGFRIEYTIHDELKNRVVSMRKKLQEKLAGLKTLPLNLTINLNYGHPCGTTRAGNDPRTSVVDKNCKAHGVDNLYIVDGSIMPTSGGTNPSLTIAANALRVAAHLVETKKQ